jgi:segregation and condensation protein B
MNEQTNPEFEQPPEEANEAGPPEETTAEAQPPEEAAGESRPEDDADEEPSGEEPPATALEPAPIDIAQVKRVLEAALLSAGQPLTVQQLKRLFGGEVDADNIRKVLDELKDEWSERSIELTAVASGWRFRVKPDYQKFLDRISSEKPPRYSRAVLETLAIVAYRQPVTRGDIEEIRGVAVSPPTLKALEERGWIEVIGHRESPGRPAIFATTKKFLDDLNLRSLEELPPLEELQASLAAAPAALVDAPPPAPDQQPLIDEPPPEESSESTEQESHAG